MSHIDLLDTGIDHLPSAGRLRLINDDGIFKVLDPNGRKVTVNLGEVVVSGGDPSVINVMDYGAAGDGVTDDRAAIQLAINALEASETSNVLYFPRGIYLVNTKVADGNTSLASWRNLLIGNSSLAGRDIKIIGEDAEIIQDNGSVRAHLFVVLCTFRSLWVSGIRLKKVATMLAATGGEPVGNDAFAFVRTTTTPIDFIRIEKSVINNFHGLSFFYGVNHDYRGIIRKFIVQGCEILNPYGANTINSGASYGGGQVIRLNSLIDVAEITDNRCEGADIDLSNATYCEGGRLKDAIVFGDPRVLVFERNTVRRYGVEVVFATANFNLLGTVGATPFNVPAVSATVSVTVSAGSVGLSPATFTAGQVVCFYADSVAASFTVVSWNPGTLALVIQNDGLGGTPGSPIPAGASIYLDEINDCSVSICNNLVDLALPIGAHASTMPQGIMSSVRGVIGNNRVLHAATGISSYANVTTPSANQADGLLVIGNFVLTKDNTDEDTSCYGMNFEAPGAIVKDNVVIVPVPHRAYGINNNTANTRVTGNFVKSLVQAANGYSNIARSLGVCVGNQSSGTIFEGNHTIGFDVGCGSQSASQNIPCRIINHVSTNDVLAIGESRTAELGAAGAPGADAPLPTDLGQYAGLTLDLQARLLNKEVTTAAAYSNGSAVTFWTSRKKTPVYGNDVQLTTAGGPTYKTTTLSGIPGLAFDGSNDHATAAVPITNIIGRGEFTIIIACNATALNTAGAAAYAHSQVIGNAIGNFGIYCKASGGSNIYGVWCYDLDNAPIYEASAPAVAVNTDVVLVATFKDGVLSFRINQGATDTDNCLDLLTTGGDIYLGYGGYGGRFAGYMNRVAMFNRCLAATELTNAVQLVMDEFGIP